MSDAPPRHAEPFDPPGEPWVRVSPRLATLRRLLTVVGGLLGLAVVTALAWLVATWLAVVAAVAGLALLVWVWIAVGRRVRSWGYAERAGSSTMAEAADFGRPSFPPRNSKR